jgi:hypothetical protein
MPQSIEVEFHKAMLGIYEHALAECGYRATRFLNLVNRIGGFQAAKQLLRSDTHSEGLTALWEYGRLDLSMEALVLQQPWRSLFSRVELDSAERRLQKLGYATHQCDH